MKGVSPLIGVVLLIGISFGIFVILSTWGGEYLQISKKQSEEKYSQILDCSLASIHAEKVFYNASSGNFTILLENGNVEFNKIVFSLIFEDKVFDEELEVLLKKGEKKVFNVHFDENACNMKFLRITTPCPNAKENIKKEEITFLGC